MGEKQSKTSRFPFTIKRLSELPAPTTGRVYHYDAKAAGLALCVTKTGAKTFYLYRKIDGRPERVRLGKFPEVSVEDARDAVKGMVGEIAKGNDPAAEHRAKRTAPTLGELFQHWWKTHSKPHKKTWADDERIFKKYFGAISGKRLAAIHKGSVKAWHTRLGEKHGPYQANRARALLSAMWACATDLGCNEPNPCVGVKKFKEQSRERYLQPEEMKAFFAALADEEPIWRDFFLLCLFTGARRGNIAAMRWTEIDIKRGAWHITGEKMKAGLPMVVVLAEPALAVLTSRLAEKDESPWVFPANGRLGIGHVVDPRKAWTRVLKRAEIENLRMHDLRRSLGSWQATAGTSLVIIGKSLGHRDHKATQVYARLQLDPVRKSVENAIGDMRRAAGLLEAGDKTIDVDSDREGENDGTK